MLLVPFYSYKHHRRAIVLLTVKITGVEQANLTCIPKSTSDTEQKLQRFGPQRLKPKVQRILKQAVGACSTQLTVSARRQRTRRRLRLRPSSVLVQTMLRRRSLRLRESLQAARRLWAEPTCTWPQPICAKPA